MNGASRMTTATTATLPIHQAFMRIIVDPFRGHSRTLAQATEAAQGTRCLRRTGLRMAGYREQVEAEIAALTRELLDSAEEHYGAVPHVDVFGVVIAASYTPEDAEPDDDQAFTHDAVSYRFSNQKPWVQVGVLQSALRLAESDE
jgi:hypothetical protein